MIKLSLELQERIQVKIDDLDLCRLGGGTEPNIHAYFVGLRYRYTQPTILRLKTTIAIIAIALMRD
ncbi:hypothetical protein [Nostoc sp. FACHB-110]|uniref:hypothetical protein n=1 Tax=Nostoc sp. FACHB-110 TaxID=2692834 RepID=UPI0016828249|nr:hypothetical protein [Nostoc sp. FACHB-110]MBD2441230.1 hypothetical protein [Nostoc sp. FACHB-110]